MPTLSYVHIVELSHPIHPAIPRWPGDPPVSFTQAADRNQDGYFLRSFSMGEHSATHLNAPLGFFAGAVGVDAIPSEALIRPAVVIDIREEAAANPDFALSIQHVQAWESRHGRIAAAALRCCARVGGHCGTILRASGGWIRQDRPTFRDLGQMRLASCWKNAR